MNRTATAIWTGTGKEGKGNVSTETGTLNNVPYNYVSRFEDGKLTNPEELIAAAHAGCFSMKLAFILNSKGLTADEIKTTCSITFESGTLKESTLKVTAKIQGAEKQAFLEMAEDAKKNCPVSKSLSIPISLEAELL